MTPLDLGYEAELAVAGAGPPLVYVPGMDGSGRLLYTQLPTLIRSYRVATYQLRGGDATWDDLVLDLRQIIDALGAPATIVAESFGGALALRLALAHPDRVRRLVLVNSFPYLRRRGLLALGRLSLRLMPTWLYRLTRPVAIWLMCSATTEPADRARFRELTSDFEQRDCVARLDLLAEHDLRWCLPLLDVPFTFIVGDRDLIVPAGREAELMASRVQNGSVRVLRGHGHACLLAPDVDLGQLLDESSGFE